MMTKLVGTRTYTAPSIIALVGHPKAGKSTTAEIICNYYGHKLIDTGGALRDIAIRHLGLTRDQVYTQEGKSSYVIINGKTWQVRDILGQLGEKFEELFGDHAMPFMSMANNSRKESIVDASCRKNQGEYWKSIGGVIIEVRNPNVEPSPYAFDKFDSNLVDYVIENDGVSKIDLFNKINIVIAQIVLDTLNGQKNVAS